LLVQRRLRVAQVAAGRLPVRFLEVDADEATAEAHGLVAFAADAREWREHDFVRRAPQLDDALCDRQLQRADMAFVGGVAADGHVEHVRL
jgi:hypothetical protein